jgi:putative glutamine amidotransferase
MKPRIGITANYSFSSALGENEGIGVRGQEWQLLADDYIASVLRGGGIPVILPVVRNKEDMAELAESVDGVLFSGGKDVDPLRFGQTPGGKSGIICPQRDEQELFLARYVLEKTSKPILGVCRGIQVINAAFGGALHQHLPDTKHPCHSLLMYPRERGTHKVRVEPDSLLRRIVEADLLYTNSFHHMGIDVCAETLKVTGWAEDGLAEAVELKDNPAGRFFLAVQWHPEMMAAADETQQRILTTFVESCKRR